VWMVERRYRARLALKPLAEEGITRNLRQQDLDRNSAIQTRVAGAIHFAHAARTNSGNNLVGAEAGAGNEGHGVERRRRL